MRPGKLFFIGDNQDDSVDDVMQTSFMTAFGGSGDEKRCNEEEEERIGRERGMENDINKDPSTSHKILLPVRYQLLLRARQTLTTAGFNSPRDDEISSTDDVKNDWRKKSKDIDQALLWLRQEIVSTHSAEIETCGLSHGRW